MIWFAFLLLVQLSLGAAPVEEVEVPVGETVYFSSPHYPEFNAPGTHRLWELTTQSDSVIEVTCLDMNITSSVKCKAGYLDVTDGRMGPGKWCGSIKGITLTSHGNKMTADLKLSTVSGYFKCSAKGVAKEESNED